MSDQLSLEIASRANPGSASSRKLRRAGRLPATLYGHGTAESVSLDLLAFRREITPDHYGAVVVHLTQGETSVGTALVKSVQVDTIKHQLLHVDLQRVDAADRIHVVVPVVLQGEPDAVRLGGVLEQAVHTINLRCRADDVPAQISYDVTPLGIGDAVHAEQLALPAGSELLERPDDVIAVILAPTVPALEEAVNVEPAVSGPELVGEKQKEDFPSER
ncbi:MAG TPA: 50S ribosomal protein L25 [Armatimonadota bacterium]|jgi:large subunit ribosomal protein L25